MKKEELLKERNDLAKQFALAGHDITTCVSMANRLMDDMYGNVTKGFLVISDKAQEYPKGEQGVVFLDKPQDGITIHVAKDGEKSVRVKIFDEDFLIAAHNLDDGKEYKWQEAMDRLKEVGKTTFNKKQMYLIAAYIDQINATLDEIGGDKLTGYCWSSTEYNSLNAWGVGFGNGYIDYSYKCSEGVVRPVAALN